MEEFLKTVAKHYKSKAQSEAVLNNEPASLPLSRYLFCFPNRRSGLFFARYLKDSFNGPCIAPSTTTINELFGLFSSRKVADRISLLFRLYECYKEILQDQDHEEFDQFVFWGDMILSDNDDIDKYLADADKVFANVRDLKEIDSLFEGFTESQIEIIRRFWNSFNPATDYNDGDKRIVFGQTWSILSRLYHMFREVLQRDNLAYEGMMEREVVEKLQSEGFDSQLSQLPFDKVVFVGLTAVSKVDRALMSMLKLANKAEFCWDYADPQLQAESSKATSAAFFTKSNLEDFANELSPEELAQGLVPQKEKNIKLYAVASGVGQTSKAQQILSTWVQEKNFQAIRTAVVLPDEKLLLPMLYAIPQGIGAYNVTMGYGLKNSPVFSFVSSLSALQKSCSNDSFYYQKVYTVLEHGITICKVGEEAVLYKKEIVKNNISQVPQSFFQSSPFLSQVFRPLKDAQDTVDYLKSIFAVLIDKAAEDIRLNKESDDSSSDETDSQNLDCPKEESIYHFSETDYEFLYHYNKILLQLETEMQDSSVRFTSQTLFMLLEKLVVGSTVPFSGEPLNGLQVMGVLETRALDFDNVIILSMNEGTFPAKSVQNTFIPMSLRDAFGLPTQRHRDSVFAYHFYRLISRAKRVAMIYDNRTEGMQTGEESRYVKQLRYLLGYDQLTPIVDAEDVRMVNSSNFTVQKTEAVRIKLNDYTGNKARRYLSATALKHYIKCPMMFYYQHVLHLEEDSDVAEDVDNPIFGNILHKSICGIYEPFTGKEVIQSDLENLIKNSDSQDTVVRKIDEVFKTEMGVKEISGYNLLIKNMMVSYVKAILEHDIRLCPFLYVRGEMELKSQYLLDDNSKVNIYCGIDRIDSPSAGSDRRIRIVDYKTGNSNDGEKLLFPSIEDLFTSGGKEHGEAFQVMFYSFMLSQSNSPELKTYNLEPKSTSIAPHLYFVRGFYNPQAETSISQGTKKNAEKVEDFKLYASEFNDRLKGVMSEIFDQNVAFKQCEDIKQCKHCSFSNLCNRI